jgi:hypothetical protein
MKLSITLLAMSALMAGTVACSSTPKVEESAPVAEASAPAEQPAPVLEAPAASQSDTSTSLGAGSSGRGH